MNYGYIDEWAIRGYEYATGKGKVPSFPDDLSLDAFNAGISNANIRNGTQVAPIHPRSRTLSSGPSGRSDKELAILGPW